MADNAAFLKNLTKDLGKKGLLAPHLNNWFAANNFPDEIKFSVFPNKPKDDAFHPSSAIKCARVAFAERMGHTMGRPFTAEQYKTFMFGNYCHAIIQYIVVEELHFATWADIERHFYYTDKDVTERTHPAFVTERGHPYDVRGSVDISHCVVPNKGTYLVDIKTMNSRLYAMNEISPATWEKYEAQVQLYLEFCDLDAAILLCAEKDSPHRFKEFVIQRNGDAVDAIFDRWESVVDAQAAGEEPPDCTCYDPDRCLVSEIYECGYSV